MHGQYVLGSGMYLARIVKHSYVSSWLDELFVSYTLQVYLIAGIIVIHWDS